MARTAAKKRTAAKPSLRARRPPKGPLNGRGTKQRDAARAATQVDPEHAAKIALRREEVWRMAVAGASVTAISVHLKSQGFTEASRTTVWNDIQAEMDERRGETKANVDRYVAMHVERCERITLALLPEATGRQHPNGTRVPPNLHAVDRLLRVMERQARLLGLDAQKAEAGSADDAFRSFLLAADERYTAMHPADEDAPALPEGGPPTIDITPERVEAGEPV